jgi:hypothetical protein
MVLPSRDIPELRADTYDANAPPERLWRRAEVGLEALDRKLSYGAISYGRFDRIVEFHLQAGIALS